jgi:long-chain acyl-CoA synthetase
MDIDVRAISESSVEVEGCDTIPKLFNHQVRARGIKTAFREKRLGIWRATSWRDYGEAAKWTGLGLVSLGLQQGEVVSILAETKPTWLYADMGVMGAGGVSNGIYPTDAAKQVEYILNDSRSRFLFVESDEQLDKYLEVRERCPHICKVIVFDVEGLSTFSDPQVLSFDSLLALGRVYDEANPGLWAKLIGSSKADELALLVYTSGTTGPPKGAMLSHRNVLFQISNADSFIPIQHGGEQLAFLPLCHVAERTFTVFLPLRSGAIANFAGPRQRARGRPNAVLRRTAHLGALLFRHCHPYERGDLDRPRCLHLGAAHRPQGRRAQARGAQAIGQPGAHVRHRRLSRP